MEIGLFLYETGAQFASKSPKYLFLSAMFATFVFDDN